MMKTCYTFSFVMLTLLGCWTYASAQESGEISAQVNMIEGKSGVVQVQYNFRFSLGGDSDGIYPPAEYVQIEVPGGLHPYGGEGSIFLIELPIGSFQEGAGGSFIAVDPIGLEVSQGFENDDTVVPYYWSFTETSGVLSFEAYIHPPKNGKKFGQMNVLMSIMDNRGESSSGEPEPKFFDLLFGSPNLQIDEDEWETEVVGMNFRAEQYFPPD